MQNYKIEITGTRIRIVCVNADNSKQAIQKVNNNKNINVLKSNKRFKKAVVCS